MGTTSNAEEKEREREREREMEHLNQFGSLKKVSKIGRGVHMQLHCDSKNIVPQGNEGRREI